MFSASRFLRKKLSWIAAALAILQAHSAVAQSISLSLNVYYDVRSDVNSGGNWELMALASSGTAGISGLSVRLTDILTAQNRAPRGIVNGANPSGFTVFFNNPFPNAANPQFHNLTIGHAAPTSSGDEAAIYGVGTLLNGAPNFPGHPGTAIGPVITTFTNPQGSIPWGTGDSTFFNDPAWDKGVIMASGLFADGVTPNFFAGSSGNVFTAVGTASDFGPIAEHVLTTGIVRTNFLPFPDYNNNGSVDAPDYVLWRNGGPLLNDSTPGVQPADYTVWRAAFGAGAPAPGAGGDGDLSFTSVPEPASFALLAVGVLFVLAASRRKMSARLAVVPARNCGKTARDSARLGKN